MVQGLDPRAPSLALEWDIACLPRIHCGSPVPASPPSLSCSIIQEGFGSASCVSCKPACASAPRGACRSCRSDGAMERYRCRRTGYGPLISRISARNLSMHCLEDPWPPRPPSSFRSVSKFTAEPAWKRKLEAPGSTLKLFSCQYRRLVLTSIFVSTCLFLLSVPR